MQQFTMGVWHDIPLFSGFISAFTPRTDTTHLIMVDWWQHPEPVLHRQPGSVLMWARREKSLEGDNQHCHYIHAAKTINRMWRASLNTISLFDHCSALKELHFAIMCAQGHLIEMTWIKCIIPYPHKWHGLSGEEAKNSYKVKIHIFRLN